MRFILAAFTAILALAASTAGAQALYEEGVHYQVLSKEVPTQDPTKIEVTEVFWYGCGHCYTFESLVHPWAEKQPEDVNFVQSPAIWNGAMELHAKAYYTAKALNILDKTHKPLFDAFHKERRRFASEGAIAAFYSEHGVDKDTFKKTFNSFGVASQVNLANSKARGYGISGTPEIVVDGKYRVSTKMAGSQAGMLKVADYLVNMIRAEKVAAN